LFGNSDKESYGTYLRPWRQAEDRSTGVYAEHFPSLAGGKAISSTSKLPAIWDTEVDVLHI